MTYQSLVQNWKDRNIQSISDLELVLDTFKINFAYHSGKIENEKVSYHHTRDIFENGIVNGYSGDLRTLFEQQNQKNCYEYLLPKIVAREPMSLLLVREVHRILTAGTYDMRRFLENDERPGEFKKHDYVIGRNEVGAAPDEVAGEMEELLAEMQTPFKDEQLLTAASYFHAKFESIHPFADGNGRVGRILVNYFLMIHNHPPFIVFNENKGPYYAALDAFDEKGDIAEMKQYFETALCQTWQGSEERNRQTKGIDDFIAR